MFPGLDPKKMQAVMKQMGISQQEIDASKVTIEKTDGSRIIIEPASVTKIKMQGQETFQVVGEIREETGEVGISEEDIQTVMEKTGASKAKAKKALEETGDLAEAILKLSE
jgi:nascent polypeptide-associated complex subunit alpha